MAELIWAVPILPLVGFIINSLLLSYLPAEIRRKIAGWIAAIASTAAFAVAVTIAVNLPTILAGQDYRNVDLYDWIAIAGSPLKIPMGLRIDALSVTMMLVVTGVGSLIHYFSIGYMSDDERVYRFFSYLNLFMFAMLMLVLGSSYALMFVGWEGVGLASYLLIGFFFQKVSAAQAGKKAFLINRVGDFGFLLGMFALFWLTGSLTFNTPDGTGALDQAAKLSTATIWGFPAVTVICLLFFLGATGKSAQLPLYLWLPDAMEGPTPVSALIHAATMVTAGVYLIARSAALFGQDTLVQGVICTIGITTAFFAALTAFRQYDIKRVLAWSTISQLGYMFVGVGVGAYAAGISHLVTHAFFKALMFLGAGAVMHALEGQLDMRKMGNMKRHMPVTYATFTCGWLAICGVPLLSGFWSKDAILEHVWHRGLADPSYMIVFWLGAITALMTAFYMTRMYVTVFHGTERIEMGDEGHGGDAQEHGDSHAHAGHGHGHDAHGHGHAAHAHGHGHGVHVHPEQKIMNAPLMVLAVLSVFGGVVAFILPGFIYGVTTKTVPTAHHTHSITLPAPKGAEAHGAAADHAAAETHAEAAPTPSEGGTEHSSEATASTEAGGEHGAGPPPAFEIPDFGKQEVLIPTIIGSLAGIIGLLWAMFGVGSAKFARGWSPGTERFLAAPDTIYQGVLHAVFVKGGTRISEVLYTAVDKAIDWLVNAVAWVVDYFAESLRTLQTGYVRNYALVMLAGAVFVVACFMIILQQTAR